MRDLTDIAVVKGRDDIMIKNHIFVAALSAANQKISGYSLIFEIFEPSISPVGTYLALSNNHDWKNHFFLEQSPFDLHLGRDGIA